MTQRMPQWAESHPSLPYTVPFIVFFVFLAVHDYLLFLGEWEYVIRAVVLTAVLWMFSRQVIDLRVRSLVLSTVIGLAVFVIWIAPDLLLPGYRDHWLFQNSIMGTVKSSVPEDMRSNWLVLIARGARAVLIVPIVEELFWRAWLMRWLINPDFRKVPLGAYSTSAMVITAVLFASEHGPYWDVGLITGFIYNWLMVRTKSLGDCILAHAITNGVLSGYVLLSNQWQYWL
jgi:uncharacterized protein